MCSGLVPCAGCSTVAESHIFDNARVGMSGFRVSQAFRASLTAPLAARDAVLHFPGRGAVLLCFLVWLAGSL